MDHERPDRRPGTYRPFCSKRGSSVAYTIGFLIGGYFQAYGHLGGSEADIADGVRDGKASILESEKRARKDPVIALDANLYRN